MAQYTVKEVAERCNVTKQAVNKYLRTSGLQDQAIRDGNRFLIPDNLRERIETHFSKNINETETATETIDNSETETENNENGVSVPWAVYEDLRKQLEVKDKQIADLSVALDKTADSLKAAQALHAVEKKDELLLPAPELEELQSMSWWQFRKWKKGNNG